ncbi:hypothetical protein LCGC14_2795450 [marine sediment metagenome]|uniref:Uncharacterized protein n=1 Tax=marine sediment metagenome TaxID=412755 RepID=A0A0F8YPB9_9ZZZZ
MALATTLGMVHLPFGERPQYGSPYPEGMAVAHSDVADDASGGDHTFTILADGGFLYRLELVNLVRGSGTIANLHIITSHRWASDKSGLGNSAFDLNWDLIGASVLPGFSVYGFNPLNNLGGVSMLRRFPMGRTEGVALQQVINLTVISQVNTITNEMSFVFTYWRKESLYQPGFLSSFFEAPASPPLVRSPIGG